MLQPVVLVISKHLELSMMHQAPQTLWFTKHVGDTMCLCGTRCSGGTPSGRHWRAQARRQRSGGLVWRAWTSRTLRRPRTPLNRRMAARRGAACSGT